MCAPQVIDQFDLPAITRLFDETAFVGMSSYPSLSPHFKADQLENALWQFAREIKHFGVNLEKVCPGAGRAGDSARVCGSRVQCVSERRG